MGAENVDDGGEDRLELGAEEGALRGEQPEHLQRAVSELVHPAGPTRDEVHFAFVGSGADVAGLFHWGRWVGGGGGVERWGGGVERWGGGLEMGGGGGMGASYLAPSGSFLQ